MSTINTDQTTPVSPPAPPSVVFNDIDRQIDYSRKIDLAEAIKLYFDRGLTEAQIAKLFECSNQAVNQALKPYKQLILAGPELQAFRDNRVRIKDSIEYNLLLDISSPQKREAASLNNCAYAYSQIHTTRRLDEGLSTSNVDLHAEFESLKQLRDAKLVLQNAVSQTTQTDYHEW